MRRGSCSPYASAPTRRSIGYINIHNLNAVHRSADLGMRIGDERHRGQGFGKLAMAMAPNYCWNHLNLE